MLEIQENEKYLGENGIEYLVIQKDKDIALLKSNYEYVIANGISINNESNKITWDYGKYFTNLLGATVCYEEQTCTEIEQINNLKEALKCAEHFVYFSAVVENEMNYDNLQVDDNDLEKLNSAYAEYMATDDMTLVSEMVIDLMEECGEQELDGEKDL